MAVLSATCAWRIAVFTYCIRSGVKSACFVGAQGNRVKLTLLLKDEE